MTTTIVALDLETTGLDPERHHIWEVGAIVRDHRDDRYNGEWHIMMRPDLALADPVALRIGRYYERSFGWISDGSSPAWIIDRPVMQPPKLPGMPQDLPVAPRGGVGRREVGRVLASMLDGAHLVGANPAFDAAFLTRFLRSHGQAPTWHYHLVDVQALAVGYSAGWRAHTALFGAAPGAAGLEPASWRIVPWKSAEISAALGIEVDKAAKHTAVGDARWALAVYDAVRTGAGKGDA